MHSGVQKHKAMRRVQSVEADVWQLHVAVGWGVSAAGTEGHSRSSAGVLHDPSGHGAAGCPDRAGGGRKWAGGWQGVRQGGALLVSLQQGTERCGGVPSDAAPASSSSCHCR